MLTHMLVEYALRGFLGELERLNMTDSLDIFHTDSGMGYRT